MPLLNYFPFTYIYKFTYFWVYIFIYMIKNLNDGICISANTVNMLLGKYENINTRRKYTVSDPSGMMISQKNKTIALRYDFLW